MYLTDNEILSLHETGVHLLAKQIETQKLTVKEIRENIPGYLHFNRLDTFGLIHVNANYETYFELEIEKIKEQGISFVEKYFQRNTKELFIPEIIAFGKQNKIEKTVGQFHRIRPNTAEDYQTFVSFTKVCKRFDCFLSVSNNLDIFGDCAHRLNQVVDDNVFMRNNLHKFKSLTKRETEIMHCVGQGKSRNEIVDELYISKHTFDTHRKNIRQKLDINNPAMLYKYIHVFGL